MAGTPLDARERAQLCARMEELGPDAPTLCEGWDVADLAAHLVVRERRPLGAIGILVEKGPFPGLTERAMATERAGGFDRLLERVRSGPPPGPFRLPVVRERAGTAEWFTHHEDVRRANAMTEPRRGIDDVHALLWRMLRPVSRLLYRKVPDDVGVALEAPGHGRIEARSGVRNVAVIGEPGELLLFTYGRRDHAVVELQGHDAAVEALQRTATGI